VLLQLPIFTVRETHGRVVRPGNRVIAHSPEIGWRSLYGAIIQEAPFRATEPAIGNPSFIYHLTRPTEVTRQIEGTRAEKTVIGPRRITLTPGEAATSWQHSGNPEILQVYLRQSVYASAFAEMYACDPLRAELLPRFAMQDPLLEQLAIVILRALRDGSSDNSLYIDTLAQMMAVHLAREHSTRSRPPADHKIPGVSGWRIRRLVDYIEDNLDSDLRLEAMADEVEISPLYLARAFKSAVGQSPHQYVLERRIEKAKGLLRDTEMPIVDVALATGFSSQSHLSNWFLRHVGVSPATFRREGSA
jgi:AraC family transcriptional regulator